MISYLQIEAERKEMRREGISDSSGIKDWGAFIEHQLTEINNRVKRDQDFERKQWLKRIKLGME